MSEILAPDEAAQAAIDAMLADPDDWAARFLAAYPQNFGVIGKSCIAAGIGRKVFYNRLEREPAFRAIFEQAVKEFDELLEYVAWDRAVNGTERPVYQGGHEVGRVREVDNRHLQWMLERRNPEKFHIPLRVEFAKPDEADFVFRMGEADDPATVELPRGDVTDSEDAQAD